MSAPSKDSKLILLGLAAVAVAGLIYFSLGTNGNAGEDVLKKLPIDDDGRSDEPKQAANVELEAHASAKEEREKMDEKSLHALVEELDRQGKAFFQKQAVLRSCWGVHRSAGND